MKGLALVALLLFVMEKLARFLVYSFIIVFFGWWTVMTVQDVRTWWQHGRKTRRAA